MVLTWCTGILREWPNLRCLERNGDTLGARGQADMTASCATTLLTLNGGSSSIRFAMVQIDCIGLCDTTFVVHDADGRAQECRVIESTDYGIARDMILDWLELQQSFSSIQAVGHRAVTVWAQRA